MRNQRLNMFSNVASKALGLTMLLLFSVGCNPQYVVVIDTDAPTLSQVLAPNAGLSPDAAIDLVRVDVMDGKGQLLDVCELSAPRLEDWPLSFGVAANEPVRLRVRGFKSERRRSSVATGFARRCGETIDATKPLSVAEPYPEATIDRVVDLATMSTGSKTVRIKLALGCMGAPADFWAGTNCIDETEHAAPFTTRSNIDDGTSDHPSVAGTSLLARETECNPKLKPQGVDTVCVRGGFSLQGDLWIGALGIVAPSPPTPLRAVRLSAFYLDRTEYTVRRFWEARRRHPDLEEPQPKGTPMQSFLGKYCTWNPLGPPSDKALNCVNHKQARTACQSDGGALPTEAQWEFEARGRGRSWRFPWGARQPMDCCQASMDRRVLKEKLDMNGKPVLDPGGNPVVTVWSGLCPGVGPEDVGMHQGRDCAEGGDISIDGILDLGGSITEDCLDVFRPYEERCGLGVGVTRDPVCKRDNDDDFAHVSRGSNWSQGLAAGDSAIRYFTTVSPGLGFRCAYRGE